MSISEPVRFSSDLESIKDDEPEVIAGLNEQFDLIMRKTAGDQLGYHIVAEGIETDEIRDRLVEWGCDESQGYLFSKPLGVETFEDWILSRSR